ncbi:hypothetical protein EON63_03325 [archaeon]|nr:MAG: hypothetical protein EON63_03325 [archaeon]
MAPSHTSALSQQIGMHNMSASVEESYISYSLYKYLSGHWGSIRRYREGIKTSAKGVEDWVMKNVIEGV